MLCPGLFPGGNPLSFIPPSSPPQAGAAEDRYSKLHERHEAAHAEFNRLKTISTERKQRIAGLEAKLAQVGPGGGWGGSSPPSRVG